MKSLILIVGALLPFLSLAQDNHRFVEVRGEVDYENQIDKYQAKISITANEYYAYEEDKATLEDLEKTFFEVMEKNGFEKGQFVKSDEPILGVQEKQLVYVFETASEADFVKFNNLKNTKGTAKYDNKVFYKPLDNPDEIIAEALEDAKKQAVVIAKAMRKKLGDIISVSDAYNSVRSESYYAGINKNTYRLLARFEVE
ncbi:SIMPL domain-containing protein [Olivibacter sp. SDN3]|uniref:SIMPL domain-containing protein n=1 Tax=Olivibacter sp. SDN3 TaxID=2764720 RepID=UPI001C9E6E35|nr:SIMPL domain-containing protein [Olivibacter sp. SDN3]